ncbi:MAG: DoxX family protein [Bacteroidetes bacterium]|nr:DoxX family protein [Bacteroidota bacterium]
MKYFKVVSRFLLGIVFIFSGFVKAVDPLGSAYKFADYFTAFKIGFLEFSSLPLAILLAAFELVLGVALILGYRRKIVYWLLLWFMLFFTVLTLLLAIFNPVSDCGCFGDALILTNWQTFLKNVVLMIFVAILFFGRKSEAENGRSMAEWTILAIIYAGISCFSVWNFRHLPLVDFRPYDVGTVISQDMNIPEDAPVDEYETTLVYRNREDGKESSFTLADYPRDTTLWDFVSSDSKLIRKGFEPPIHDFAIVDEFGSDLVDRILADPGYTLLLISYDLENANEEALLIAGEWSGLELLADDFSFYAVSASTSEVVKSLSSSLGLEYPFYAGDEIMLKTMLRSNPGFMLIFDGVIIGKWGFRDFPSMDELDPHVLEQLENASMPLSEDEELLMEAGVYEGFSFAVMEFKSYVPDLVYEKGASDTEKGVVISFILGVLVLIAFSALISPIE